MRIGIKVFVILISVAAAGIAAANPPLAISVNYDAAREELNVIVEHPVTNPSEHFIKKVTVAKNGQIVESREFTFQTSHRNQTMTPFKFSAESGDFIRVEALCNQQGMGEKTIQINQGVSSVSVTS